jgi:uncharacterized protein
MGSLPFPANAPISAPMSDQATMPRTSDDARLEVVDVLRGFALAALFLVHMMESFELYWAHPESSWLVDVVLGLFMGKSFTLLALCFGFSFFILMDRSAKRGVDFTARFAWRLTILAGIGFAHALIYRGDIMQVLAAMGFLLLIADRVKNNTVLLWAAAFFLAGPTLIVQLIAAASGAAWANAPAASSVDPGMPAYLYGDLQETLRVNLGPAQLPKFWFFLEYGRLPQIIGLYLLGMVLGRIGFFGRLREFRETRLVVLIVGLVLALVLEFGRDPLRLAFLQFGFPDGAGRAFWTLTGIWLDLAATAAWAMVLIALYQGRGRWLVYPFAAMGRMTLTFYILQSVVFVPLFFNFGLGLHDDWSPLTRFLIGIAAIAAQMVFARWWLARFRYGPLEWVWRALTYTSWNVPFRRKTPVTA